MTFTVRLPKLAATGGKLVLSIVSVSDHPGLRRALPKTRRFDLAVLAQSGEAIRLSRFCLPYCSYALTGSVESPGPVSAESVEISVTGSDGRDALASRFAAAREGFLAEPGEGVLAPLVMNVRATLEHPISQMCTSNQMDEKVYQKLCRRLDLSPTKHRKQWEFIFIVRALNYYGLIRKGSRGLGFGVGLEPLTSYFVSAGCSIVATDLAPEDKRAMAWDRTSQLGDLRRIFHPNLCDEKTFMKRAAFRAVDMNDIPSDLRNFDFTWSSCAFEHLGSIDRGLQFFENSLDCLRPGGMAVHTTELNLSSNDDTLDETSTVLFRRRDFEELASRLIEKGHEVMPITFDVGDGKLDRHIDMPPYCHDQHLKLGLMRWVSTSFGMIVRKAEA